MVAGSHAVGSPASGGQGPGAQGLGVEADPTLLAYEHIRSGISLGDMKRQIERECIARALSESDGNITRAATLLGMKRPRLSQLVKQYGFGDDASGRDDLGREELDREEGGTAAAGDGTHGGEAHGEET